MARVLVLDTSTLTVRQVPAMVVAVVAVDHSIKLVHFTVVSSSPSRLAVLVAGRHLTEEEFSK